MARGQYIPIPLTCIACGTHFTRRRSRITPYCSRQCKARSPERIAAFWSYANPVGECWIWQRSTNRKGYGWFSWCKRPMLAHILAYEFTYGAVPEGKQVCHTCDTPACINPAHLFAGTPKENTDDMVSKGRHAHGEATPIAKLTEAQARSILAELRAGSSYNTLGRKYGVTGSTIGKLATGETWKHLHATPPAPVAPKPVT